MCLTVEQPAQPERQRPLLRHHLAGAGPGPRRCLRCALPPRLRRLPRLPLLCWRVRRRLQPGQAGQAHALHGLVRAHLLIAPQAHKAAAWEQDKSAHPVSFGKGRGMAAQLCSHLAHAAEAVRCGSSRAHLMAPRSTRRLRASPSSAAGTMDRTAAHTKATTRL